MSDKKVTRLEWIDSLRGMAALAVAAMHIYERLRSHYPDIGFFKKNSIAGFIIEDFLNFGKVGIVVFFLISGFVIPFSLYNKDIRQFSITRFFRLYPAYWVSIILALIINGMPAIIILLANITMLQKFVGIPDMVGVYWTLQIELIFYVICALLFFYKVLYNKKVLEIFFYCLIVSSVIVSVIRYVTEIKLPVALLLGLTVMFLGILFRKCVFQEDNVTKNDIIRYVSIFIITLLPISFLAYNKDFGFEERWYKYFASYTFAVFIFYIFLKFKWHNKVFVFLGAISYSLYLIHPVIGVNLVDKLRTAYFINMSPLIYTALFFFFSISSAALCYYGIEKPAIRIGKYLIKKGQKQQVLNLDSQTS